MTNITVRSVPTRASLMLEQSGIHPLLARLYAARGVTAVEEIDTRLADLLPPEGLKGLDEAAKLLADAVEGGKRLLIVADYDCDGATACAVGLRALRRFGATVDYLVPNRFETGYGLSPEVVELAAARKPDVIVTVDNGIASVDGVAAAKRRGIATVITDHHLPGEVLPDADVIVNPNQPGWLGFTITSASGSASPGRWWSVIRVAMPRRRASATPSRLAMPLSTVISKSGLAAAARRTISGERP